jgi:DUF1680 family protein
MERRDFLRTGVAAGAAILGSGACAPRGAASGAAGAASSGPVPLGSSPSRALLLQHPRLQARRVPLSGVRLTGGPLRHAQQLDLDYLVQLEPDRMLAHYRERAGLKPKAEGYGGWDGAGRNLTGHVAGHYLSAVSLMWLATGDERMKQRADYIVGELKEVQDANGDGYLSALEGGREAFRALSGGEIRSGGFDLNGLWSPWYTLHKTFAGLRDAYRHTGNPTALEVETGFAGWAEGVLAPLSEEQIQRMLNTEFGGMNEVLADLYADTGDARWLKLSYAFEHRALTEPMQRHQDVLGGKHANTQVPKFIGSASRFGYTGELGDALAAGYFFDQVVQHHSFATGGHGSDEYFAAPDVLGAIVDGRTDESCNVYNMLKLGRQLFEFRPDAYYADFQERALFNHVLGSIAPDNGDTCYMVPVGRGVQREYQQMFRSFTCCVGTGMENHALHGDGLYYQAADRLWVNVYAPSTAEWEEGGVGLAMETDFPEGDSATLTLRMKQPRAFTLSLRRPYWTGEGFRVTVNGAPVELPAPARADRRGGPADPPVLPGSSDYVDVQRTWQDGDAVAIALPRSLRLEPLPDDPRRVAVLWGPLVLAGDLGPERPRGRDDERPMEETVPTPVFVAAERPVEEWVVRVPGEPARFRTAGVGRDPDARAAAHDVDLVPFYRLHRRMYAAYWDTFTPAEWEEKKAEYAAEEARRRKLEAATVAFVQPGEMQPERDYHFQGGEDAQVRRVVGRAARSGRSWFSFDLPVEPAHPMTLVVTYYSDDRRSSPASFQILVDGQRLAAQQVEREIPGRFYDVEYEIPAGMVHGKNTVTVRFQADERSQIAAVFGVRMIRADAAR